MTAEALAAASRDPTALVGARVAQWNGNLRPGSDRLYVVEADEYDRSFLALSPTVAVVTNVEADHLDIYGDVAEIRRAFAAFVRGARTIVLCDDDRGASTLALPSATEVVRYGIRSADARLRALNVRMEPAGTAFAVEYDGELLGSVALRLAGVHNVLNALAAVGAGLALGAPFAGLAYGLAQFTGAERRFERIGDAGGVIVIDDYAHHPTEISATLAAARATFPDRRILVAFQPRRSTRARRTLATARRFRRSRRKTRRRRVRRSCARLDTTLRPVDFELTQDQREIQALTRDFAREFAYSLSAGDLVFLTEIYPARERPIAGVTADLIAQAFGAERRKLAWRGERATLADALASEVRDGDVVITMGAGDITKTGLELLDRLRRAA